MQQTQYLSGNLVHETDAARGQTMIKELVFQKGWIGKTISRAETVERLNPIMREHMIVNRSYDAVIHAMPGTETADLLANLQKTARMNVSKLAETVFSCGGTAYSGTDLDPAAFALPGGVEGLEKLGQLDSDLLDALNDEGAIEHQMRTRAILDVLRASTKERLDALRAEQKKIR